MKNQNRIKHAVIELCLLVTGVFLLYFILNNMNIRSNIRTQNEDNITELQMAVEKINAAEQTCQENNDTFDTYAKSQGNIISYYIDHHEEGMDALSTLADEWGVDGYQVVNGSGDVVLSHNFNLSKAQSDYQSLQKDGQPVTLNHLRYYVSSLSNGNKLFYSFDYTQEESRLETYYSTKASLNTLAVGNTSTITVIDANTHSIIYDDDNSLIGLNAQKEGYPLSTLVDGYSGKCDIQNITCYVSVIEDNGNIVVASKPYSDLEGKNILAIRLILMFVAIVLGLLIVYSDFIHKDRITEHKEEEKIYLYKNYYVNRSSSVKIRFVMVLGIIVIMLATFYLETLSPLSRQGTLSENRLSSVKEILNNNEEIVDELKKEYSNQYTQLANHIASMIQLDPTMVNHDTLKDIANIENLHSLYIFDENGDAVAMSQNECLNNLV